MLKKKHKMLVEVVSDGFMQEMLNNKTHVFVLKLEGVLIGAT